MDMNLNDKDEVLGEFKLTYGERKLDICGICKQRYNVGDRIPRILVNCGHTYCTSCLSRYYREQNERIRCPFCKKLVKHLDNIETLPLNIPIFSEIVRNDEQISMYINPDEPESMTATCEKHNKQKHFFCSFHHINFCRECIRQFHKDDKCCVVDLIDIQKLFALNEQNMKKNQQIVKIRKKYKGKMHKDEFYIANSN
jgi:hypothetical protein